MSPHPGWMIVAFSAPMVIGGLVWIFLPGIPLGRLPGDIRIENGNSRIYIPITTCILASLLLSGLMRLVRMITR